MTLRGKSEGIMDSFIGPLPTGTLIESSQLIVNQKTNLEQINTVLLENISGLIFTILTKNIKIYKQFDFQI